MRIFGTAAVVLLVCPFLVANTDWPGWGGPNGNFALTDAGSVTWSETGPNELWRRPLGPGYSAIVSGGDQIYTAYYRDGGEAVVAINAHNGETVWETHYKTVIADSQVKDFGIGPNASPLLHEGHLYTLSFDGQLHCLSADSGKVVWRHDLVSEMGAEILNFGASAAPFRYKDMVMVLVGGREGIVGFDPKSGEVKWKSEPVPVNYAIPTLISPGGVEQFVLMAKKEAVGISTETGKKLWSVPHANQYDVHCASPLWGDNDLLFVVSQRGSGSKTVRLTSKDGGTKAEIVSETNQFNVFFSNAIREGNVVYGADRQILSAIDIETSELLWRERGFARANLIKAGNTWIIQSEDGELTLARLSPEKFEKLGSIQLLQKPAWTPPTLVGNRLYLRDKEIVIALDLS